MSSVQVAVRARPFSQRELESGTGFCIEVRGDSTVLYKSAVSSRRNNCGNTGHGFAKEFVFDHSYWSVNQGDEHFVDQEKVFLDLGVPVLESAFQGYNTCVFAYGQTGSGKTHTMMGAEGSIGLIPRICEGLFGWMANTKGDSGEQVSYKNEVSYMEIYNERVVDLLQVMPVGKDGRQLHQLRVREHPKEGPYVEELSKHCVEDYVGISQLIKLGSSHRATAATHMNDSSSRSHAIFTIKFTQAKYVAGLPSETVSKIHLVDLAGSERASSTDMEVERLKEGGNINRSLVCLGTVISALADMMSNQKNKAGTAGRKKTFIPYRDSVLTWLLKDSLGGNSKTIMVATISPAESSYGETLSTLRYASRAKNIVNVPTVNEDKNVKTIRDLRVEIQRLKSIISSGSTNPFPQEQPSIIQKSMSLAEDIYKKEEQVAELTRRWAGKWTDIQRIMEEHHLHLKSEGVKMVVDSMQPHFVGVDPDILSTGLVFYYLKDGATTIGASSDAEAESYSPDINVMGSDLEREHCRVTWEEHQVKLHPLSGKCFVNHRLVMEPLELCQGDLLQLGESSVLRFNHPHEAKKLREKQHYEGVPSPIPTCRTPPNKAHTLPRRRKKVSSDNNSSLHYTVDHQGGRCSPCGTSCTMIVELESYSMVAAWKKKSSQTTMAMTGNHGHYEGEAELYLLPSPSPNEHSDILSSSSSNFTSNSDQSEYSDSFRDNCSSNSHHLDLVRTSANYHAVPAKEGQGDRLSLMCLLSPLMLSVISLIALPVYLSLAFLHLLLRICGLSRNSWLLQFLSFPLSFLTVLLVSPVASICDLLFGKTLHFLSVINPKKSPDKH